MALENDKRIVQSSFCLFSFFCFSIFQQIHFEWHARRENHTNILTTSCETHYHINSESLAERCDERESRERKEGAQSCCKSWSLFCKAALKCKKTEKWKSISEQCEKERAKKVSIASVLAILLKFYWYHFWSIFDWVSNSNKQLSLKIVEILSLPCIPWLNQKRCIHSWIQQS